jgi:hypothetical protein
VKYKSARSSSVGKNVSAMSRFDLRKLCYQKKGFRAKISSGWFVFDSGHPILGPFEKSEARAELHKVRRMEKEKQRETERTEKVRETERPAGHQQQSEDPADHAGRESREEDGSGPKGEKSDE